MSQIVAAVVLALALLPGFSAWAQVPSATSYQGLLLDPNGLPRDGNETVTVRIHDDPNGPRVLYEEIHVGVPVVGGAFRLAIGRGVPTANGIFGAYSDAVFAGPDRYLELTVGGEILTPRQPFLSVAYALRAAQCLTAATASDVICAGSCVSAAELDFDPATQAELDALNALVADNANAARTNAGAIATNAGSIVTNDRAIATNAVDIGRNLNAVVVNRADIADHEARISDLETALSAPGTGRIFVPPGAFTGVTGSGLPTFPTGVSRTFTAAVGAPVDYVPGGAGDVSIKALFSGCEGSTVALRAPTIPRQIGSNPTLIILPPIVSLSIPVPPPFRLSIAALEFFRTGFSEFVEIQVTRAGAEPADLCGGSLFLRGLWVEYPTAGP